MNRFIYKGGILDKIERINFNSDNTFKPSLVAKVLSDAKVETLEVLNYEIVKNQDINKYRATQKANNVLITTIIL